MNSDSSIRSDIQALEPFASDLNAFFRRFEAESLFRKPPAKDMPEVAARRIREGRYLLRPCGCELREETAGSAAHELLEVLDQHLPERRDEVAKILHAFANGQSEPSTFAGSAFRNRGNEIVRFQRQFDLADDLVAFFAVCLVRPYRSQVARTLTEGVDLAEWKCGYCPVCGHWPNLGHLWSEDGRLTLWCLHCGTSWAFKRLQCPFCLNEDQGSLTVLSPEAEDACRLHACQKCRRYVKEIRSENPAEQFPFLQNALGAVGLDYLALQEGYIRESPLTVRYEDPDGNELLLYRQTAGTVETSPDSVSGTL
ncbi:formate dehydrogenase accessory protein FdhE [bacterium]|nr:formate dehydrogenase accessory protein FdhE [bacterium]MBU1983343.1 formate dehydrogenase accessory protein FdhE [bacterium]